ncbi:type II toxin-antitoxin system HicB family antitoxin [Candidatus Binatus sp.]|uniref:type II toxin-antitoxin system HicB family antitoxin n=1 Tax=Candidatus Binatus sp. TaxID=2811406 RepID=UPI003C762633
MRPDGLLELFLSHPERSEGTRIRDSHPALQAVRLAVNSSVKELGKRMKFRVVLQQDEDGVFVAEVPSLPGCIS